MFSRGYYLPILVLSLVSTLFLFPFIAFVLPPIQADALLECFVDDNRLAQAETLEELRTHLGTGNLKLAIFVCIPFLIITLLSYLGYTRNKDATVENKRGQVGQVQLNEIDE